MTYEQILYALTYKYRGNYREVKKALLAQELPDMIPMKEKCLFYGLKGYPKELYDLEEPPWVLFYMGDLKLLNKPKVGIVGSRSVTPYSKKVTEILAKTLAEKYVIVSGMAKGTDCIAQFNAKETIGILGNGLDVIYPKENMELFKLVKAKGLLLSEYPLGTQPRKEYFPYRNRIIAALSNKIIIAAAREKGGTMVTVEHGIKLGRDIYTVPYPFGCSIGKGNNQLIEEGALIITDYEELKAL